jgi:hypothetical protein
MEKNTKPMNQEQGAQPEEKSYVGPLNVQLDPGLLGWRLYKIEWVADRTVFTQIVATKTASGSYQAAEEYWYVGKDALSGGDALAVTSVDKAWTESPPSPPSNCQQFQAPTGATWQQVGTDITTGTLYKHELKDYYVRIGIQGSGSNKTLSVVRWYLKGSQTPAPSFDPTGSYVQVSSLGSGTTWYADSLSPPA